MPGLRTIIPGLPVIHEDDSVIVVDKPAGMLSQPGKTVSDSVLTRVRLACHDANGPLLVHRLDMDTSGLLVLAKNRTAHRHLHQQFERRRIGKRYVARLCTIPIELGGRICLPLRVDIDDRPRQVVCHEHGKTSITVWHRFSGGEPDGVWLYPLTGRTHQLRVHLAHPSGLGMAIRGDRLYLGHYAKLPEVKGSGDATVHQSPQRSERLMLHAQYIAFDHPVSGERLSFQTPASFLAISEGIQP